MSQDEEHLNLLSIFHYVIGGLFCFIGFLPLIYTALGGTFLFRAQPGFCDSPHQFPVAWLGLLLLVFGGVLFLLAQSLALAVILTGRFLAKRTHHSFILVVACLECLFFPFGTTLGVFTLIVLIRPSVKALFGCAPSASPPTPPIPTPPQPPPPL